MRRTGKPPTPLTKKTAESISEVRRAQISDAANKQMDRDENQSPIGAIAHSSNFRKKSLNLIKSGSISSPMPGPTVSSTSDRMSPEIYSPLFQLANLNLPRDRVTMNAWNRVFYDTHPLVRNAINLHASYPISKINITCKNKKVQQFFMEMAEKIDLYSIVYGAALEFWKLGEAFPYAELDEQAGIWKRITILNPDYVHVKKTVIGNNTIVSLRPDATLQRLVNSTSPADLSMRKFIPKHILNYVRRGQNIPLDEFNVSHLKLLSSPYDIRGTSVIVSIYKDLMLYDRLRESKFAQADGMINPLTLVTLGGEGDYRPTQSDIEAFKNLLEEAQYDKDFKIVTHNGVKIERSGFSGSTLDIGTDIEHIVTNIYAGLMTPKALMDQESSCLKVSDNEILTESSGWKFFDDLKEDDKIATVNPETQALEFHRPTFYKDFKFTGMMYAFKNQNVDVEVTDFHEMYLSKDGGATYQKSRALEVFDIDEINSDEKFDINHENNVLFMTTIDNLTPTDPDSKFVTAMVRPSDVTINWVNEERVFCVEVPNHVFVTRHNGKVAIHGNTYASSSVGLEVLRQRYDIFRNMIKKWLERKVFAPICEIQDFFEYKDGEKRLLVPSIDFNHMNLYDMADFITSVGQFVGNQQVSLQTLHRSLGLSYEEERRRIREEMIDNQIFAKEQQVLGGMKLAELQSLDPSKSITEPPGTETAGGAEGGLPGVEDAGGMEGMEGMGGEAPDMGMPPEGVM
jgi:hypothetical protein